MKKVLYSLYLDTTLKIHLTAQAESLGITVAELVRRYISEGLNKA